MINDLEDSILNLTSKSLPPLFFFNFHLFSFYWKGTLQCLFIFEMVYCLQFSLASSRLMKAVNVLLLFIHSLQL